MISKLKLFGVIFISILFISTVYIFIQTVRAEQSGGSPESGSTSRISIIDSSLTNLNYGSTSAGSWGDWGASWNRIYSAAAGPFNDAIANTLRNGGDASFPISVGGIDDYNNNSAIPSDTYQSDWTTCNVGNNYCGTNSTVAEKKDTNTGLTWSSRISTSSNWFIANNCAYPNGLPGDDGSCGAQNEVACQCVKKTSGKTGCEGYDDGGWRLPTQKELMMAYIDGSRGQLTNTDANYISSTTSSSLTQFVLSVNISNGLVSNGGMKVNNFPVRCVR